MFARVSMHFDNILFTIRKEILILAEYLYTRMDSQFLFEWRVTGLALWLVRIACVS
jgi:hypothetical protein